MDAGAFSEKDVVKSAKDVVLVLVDCSSGSAHANLKSKYKVRGFPSLIFTDSTGKEVGKLSDRSAEGVIKEFTDLAEKHTLRPTWQGEVPKALEKAKKSKKPLLVFVADEKKTNSKLLECFYINELVRPLLGNFVISRLEYEKGSELCDKMKLKSGAVTYVLDPTAENPYAKPIEKIRVKSPQKFKKALEKTLRNWEKSKS